MDVNVPAMCAVRSKGLHQCAVVNHIFEGHIAVLQGQEEIDLVGRTDMAVVLDYFGYWPSHYYLAAT